MKFHKRINNGCVLKCPELKDRLILQCSTPHGTWFTVSEEYLKCTENDSFTLLTISHLQNGQIYKFRMLAKNRNDETLCYTLDEVEIKGKCKIFINIIMSF